MEGREAGAWRLLAKGRCVWSPFQATNCQEKVHILDKVTTATAWAMTWLRWKRSMRRFQPMHLRTERLKNVNSTPHRALLHATFFLVRACLGSKSILTPDFPIVPRKKTFVRVICNTTFTTLLTPPQRPALPLEAQPRPPQHQPGHGRQGHSHRQRTSERKEWSGAQHDLRSSFSWRIPAKHYIQKNEILLTGLFIRQCPDGHSVYESKLGATQRMSGFTSAHAGAQSK